MNKSDQEFRERFRRLMDEVDQLNEQYAEYLTDEPDSDNIIARGEDTQSTLV